MNAWPALQTLVYDGWILRLANGYTKRANSVNALYPSTEPVDKKIQVCEQFYASRGLDVVFKLTPAVYPGNLDETLVKRDYRLDSLTSVQMLDLDGLEEASPKNSTVSETLTDNWLADFCRLSGLQRNHRPTLQQMLVNTVPRRGCASLNQEGRGVACGLGVVQNGYVGLFDIITDASCRRQGYGQQLVLDLLAWGKQRGAHTAYLQVMRNNAPALGLYAKIGFQEVYRYWYRIRP